MLTNEEIRKIVEIMMTADGECAVCAGRLIQQLEDKYPEHTETMNEVWKKEYDSEYGYRKH